jgi:ornithine cyclodeaminase
MSHDTSQFYISGEEIRDSVGYAELIEALDQMHREDVANLGDLLLSEQTEGETTNHFMVRAGWQHGRALGVKMASVFPDNRAGALPAIQASYVLFDGTTGSPLASIDGNELTWRKTAADSALGTLRLARANCKTLLMVGAGAMAPHLIRAHISVCPQIKRIEVWNRSSDRRDRLIASLRPEFNIVATDDLQRSTSNADLISCATMTKQPLIRGEWLSPGCHLDLVGAFTIDMREADDTAMRRGRVFVDSRKTTIGEIGELAIPINNGTLREQDVVADLYQLSSGDHPGRQTQDEITIFKNGGGGHLDLMTARYIYDKCRL